MREFRAQAHDYLLRQETPLPTQAVARCLFGARRHEMPETQVVVRALLSSDDRFVQTHDGCWSVIGAPAMARLLDQAVFAVVDLETTGSVIGVDEIIEIGVVLVQGGRLLRRYETLIWTDRTIPPWVARLTGIGNADLEGAPTFSDVAEELTALLDGCVFVAHDIRFDLPFLRWEFGRRGVARPAVTGLCTLQLSRDLWPDLESRSLPDLARRFGVMHENPHRASDDAAATAGVLLAALSTAQERGLVELAELYRLSAVSPVVSDLSARAAES
ncbi:MAG TPA: exonuclease domain-containing protein [Candidatus Krumholzibacteria bacterium]|nr:exonuclease domain-containing protein [Candidatus Krumholzibacteria bacterium]